MEWDRCLILGGNMAGYADRAGRRGAHDGCEGGARVTREKEVHERICVRNRYELGAGHFMEVSAPRRVDRRLNGLSAL